MSIELTACQVDELRLKAEIDRRVKLAEGGLPRNKPQAPETHKQGRYQPPGPGKKTPHFPNQSKLAPTGSVDSPDELKRPPGPEGQDASPGVGEAGVPSILTQACLAGSSAAARKIFSKLEPDTAGQILQTRFLRFESNDFRIDGLMRENGAGMIELLAVVAREPGKGQFRRFIRRLKKLYRTICVWHIENEMLKAALGRYGFLPEETVDEFGDRAIGMRWDKIFAKPAVMRENKNAVAGERTPETA